MKRIILPLATSFVLGVACATAIQAAPAMPQPDVMLGGGATSVDWHPSTSHWDHHFHSHMQSTWSEKPTAAERRIERGGTYVRNPDWSGYRPYSGKGTRRH